MRYVELPELRSGQVVRIAGVLYEFVEMPGIEWLGYLRNLTILGLYGLVVDHEHRVWSWDHREDKYRSEAEPEDIQRVRLPAWLVKLYAAAVWTISMKRTFARLPNLSKND
jgi:hypothetical protein